MRLSVLFVGVFVTVLSQYVCAQSATPEANSTEASGELGNDVQVVPDELIAVVGDRRVEFHCMAVPLPGIKIEWTKESLVGGQSEKIIPGTAGFEVLTTNTTNIVSVLRILEVTPEVEGRYFCNYGTSRAASILKVTYEGVVEIKGDRVLHEGKESNFTCYVNGLDTNNVTWVKNDTVNLPNDKLPNVVIKGSQLTIRDASIDRDRGNYSCKSTFNTVPVIERITVGGNIILKAPKSVKFTEGERARFECIAIFPNGDPEPDFTWYIGNETVISDEESGGRFNIKHSKWDKGSVLHMTDVVFGDAGNYTCIAQSNVTTVEHTIQLRVRDRLAALWPFIGIMSEVILLIIIIFIHEKCTQGDDVGEEDDDEDVAEPIKEKEKISLDGEGDMRMRSSKP